MFRRVRALPGETAARVVLLRGNHEDAWLKACREGAPEFVLPRGNGCYTTYRSFTGGLPPEREEDPTAEEMRSMATGAFFPADVVEWMKTLAYFHEDEHAIYVHAGLPLEGERWLHPSEVKDPRPPLWQRSRTFYQSYAGKRVVFGGRGEPAVYDGPFSETKELIAGFWIWEVKDMDEAVAWAKRSPTLMPGKSEIEIRPLYEMADLR